MFKRFAWLILIAAAAAGGCLTGSGAIRGATASSTAEATMGR